LYAHFGILSKFNSNLIQEFNLEKGEDTQEKVEVMIPRCSPVGIRQNPVLIGKIALG
jgi:hypothetical protein